MHVYERQPYAGDLVFTAFSAPHQDAIAKVWHGVKRKKEITGPYRICRSIRRTSEELTIKIVIRINSQSRKGGVSYILKQNFGISVPKEMREEVGLHVVKMYPIKHKELTPDWCIPHFEDHYVNYKANLLYR